MRIVKKFLDTAKPHFEQGGRLSILFYFWEAFDTFLMTPESVARGRVHVRDGLDLKRMMTFVMVALVPCIIFGMYNVGYQANYVLAGMGENVINGWRGYLLSLAGVTADPNNILFCFLHGFMYWVPVYIVTMAVGVGIEVIFSTVRKEEVNEGFFVTGMLFPCILPPTIPLWQVAVAIAFGVVVGKEVFGGTGMNFLNPALVARAFLFFAYPGGISGDMVWTAVDGHSGATALSQIVSGGPESMVYGFWDSFWGFVPGSMGETSAFCCLIGVVFLMVIGVASWRIVISCVASTLVFGTLLYFIGSDTNSMFNLLPHWHLVLGGFAFGCAFMATDPVTAANTLKGQYVYGALIGAMVILVRVLNPAYPEGMMLAILFANVFAPLIDYFVIQANIKRRQRRCQMTA